MNKYLGNLGKPTGKYYSTLTPLIFLRLHYINNVVSLVTKLNRLLRKFIFTASPRINIKVSSNKDSKKTFSPFFSCL